VTQTEFTEWFARELDAKIEEMLVLNARVAIDPVTAEILEERESRRLGCTVRIQYAGKVAK
jgi:hypothetical protein